MKTNKEIFLRYYWKESPWSEILPTHFGTDELKLMILIIKSFAILTYLVEVPLGEKVEDLGKFFPIILL